MNFSTAMRKSAHETHTENGQYALNTSGDRLLDFYSVVGALRDKDATRKATLFADAYGEDKLLATKCLFYARDIRGGLGERQTFRQLLRYAAVHHPEAIRENIPLIPYYGRFDDLYVLESTPLEANMWATMKEIFEGDLKRMERDEPCSLLAKWLKSVDASSKESRRLARKTAEQFSLTLIDYKKKVRSLRKHIDIVERRMSRGEWSSINYEAVPSRAAMIYRHAFARHDHERYDAYINRAMNGETKINADTLYPYDIIEKLFHNKSDPTLEALWKNLPNYVEPGTNAIVVADVSGSMTWHDMRPLATSIGLAMYFAERNTGSFHNLFMTFSGDSSIEEVRGETLWQKLCSISKAHWGGSTNLEAAFKNILLLAVENKVSQEEMVKCIIIISDMEIDQCCSRDMLFYDHMRDVYRRHGYEMPNVVFWNVDSRNDVFHVDRNRKGVQLVSGQSAATFKNVLSCIGMTPYQAMLEVLNSERYSPVVVK